MCALRIIKYRDHLGDSDERVDLVRFAQMRGGLNKRLSVWTQMLDDMTEQAEQLEELSNEISKYYF